MTLSRNYPYLQNDIEIIQQEELQMNQPRSYNGQQYFISFNQGVPSQYGPPPFIPSSPIFSNFPPPHPPEYESSQPKPIDVTYSNLNVHAAEFVPKLSHQGATDSWNRQSPPSQPIYSGDINKNSNIHQNLKPSHSENQIDIEFLQKDEVNDEVNEFLPKHEHLHTNNSHRQLQNKDSEINNWRDHPPNDNQRNRNYRPEQTYSHNSYREKNNDRFKQERTNSARHNRRDYRPNTNQEKHLENRLNQKVYHKEECQNYENIDQIELRQDKDGSSWSNHREHSRQEGQNTENQNQKGFSRHMDKKDFRKERNSSGWSNHRSYSQEDESHMKIKNERIRPNKRDYSHQDRQNIENTDHEERKSVGRQKDYSADKSENKGITENNQKDRHSVKDNVIDGVYSQNRNDKSKEFNNSEQRIYKQFTNTKYHNKPKREDVDSRKKKNYENESNDDTKNINYNSPKFNQREQRNKEKNINRRNSSLKDKKENELGEQTLETTLVEDDDSKRKRTGSESLESNKSFADQKTEKENIASDSWRNKYTKINEQVQENVPSESTAWEEKEFKKQRAKRRTSEHQKTYNIEGDANKSSDLFEEKKKYRDLKIERDSPKVQSNNSYEEKYGKIGKLEDQRIEDLFDKNYESRDDEYKQFLTELINNVKCESSKIIEQEQDIFEVSNSYSLAHCVAEDFRMGHGIAVSFKNNFKSVEDLLVQGQKPGGLAVLQHKTDNGVRYIYYLVTKRRSNNKPTYKDFWCSVKRLRDHVKQNDVKQLAIPKLGCGLDKLDWTTVKHIIDFLFKDIEIEILYCRFGNYEDSQQKSIPYVNIYDCSDKIVEIVEKSVILYFCTADGEVTDEMKELDEKFNILNSFKATTPKGFGIVIKHETENHILCGCIVRRNSKETFDFKSFRKCIDEINKITKDDEYTGLAMKYVHEDRDRLLHHKVITMLIHYLRYVDVYVYREEADVSLDET